MSRRNAKFATIHDLQGHISDCTLTKRDLEFIVRGLREMDKSNFTNRDLLDEIEFYMWCPVFNTLVLLLLIIAVTIVKLWELSKLNVLWEKFRSIKLK